jgi:hypothetical protein
MIIVKTDSLKNDRIPFLNPGTNTSQKLSVLELDKQIFTIFNTENKMIFYLKNFMRGLAQNIHFIHTYSHRKSLSTFPPRFIPTAEPWGIR